MHKCRATIFIIEAISSPRLPLSTPLLYWVHQIMMGKPIIMGKKPIMMGKKPDQDQDNGMGTKKIVTAKFK